MDDKLAEMGKRLDDFGGMLEKVVAASPATAQARTCQLELELSGAEAGLGKSRQVYASARRREVLAARAICCRG